MKKTPSVIRLQDYKSPDFKIDSVFLHFDLHENVTQVKSVLHIKRNAHASSQSAPLVLNGEELILKSIMIDGKALDKDKYTVDEEHLTIFSVPDHFALEIAVEIKPEENTKLSGLYKSNGNYCTQCESQGFRRITYYLDRPDVMSRFTTTITADKNRYPVLLSNGNLVDEKEMTDGRHWVKWEDPSLKPSYLFALVAGNFECLKDKFITLSGKEVKLHIYVEKGKLDQAKFAMGALKRAMRWDEESYAREYDLAIYMIVAVGDFNFGAMENKGLNIFNDKYILANSKTATDEDFIHVESVIGHEYFHNWSGNRVTIRNWFQITLKEGLTIFRDQSFTADLHSPVVERISDVNVIRTAQFAQDAGPMAHPICPDSYIEISNFYTVTVYNKGAEVIRMMQTILGKEKFRKGMELYFERHDGDAITSEEFIRSMEDVSGIDLEQFRRWYTQAGTPELSIQSHYDSNKKTFDLTIEQSCLPTPDQHHKENFFIPLAMGLLDQDGKDLPLQLENEKPNGTTRVLNIKDKKSIYRFINIPKKPIPSLLRNFSAPVKLNYSYTNQELLFLLSHDSDGFNRWDAGQKLYEKLLLDLIKDYQEKRPLVLSSELIDAFKALLKEGGLDRALLTQTLMLPQISYLIGVVEAADIDAIYQVREFIKTTLAQELKSMFLECYQKNHQQKPYEFTAAAIGERSLKNLCLAYLMQLDTQGIRDLCIRQFKEADNMTDEIGALAALMNSPSKDRSEALAAFYKKWQQENLVVDKWFSLQALSALPDTLEIVKELMKHPAFSYKNPNKVRALIGAFCAGNYPNFHNKNGSGYLFLTDQVLILDKINPQVAARILEPLTRWRKFDAVRQKLMQTQLERIMATPKLSKDVYEIVERSLKF